MTADPRLVLLAMIAGSVIVAPAHGQGPKTAPALPPNFKLTVSGPTAVPGTTSYDYTTNCPAGVGAVWSIGKPGIRRPVRAKPSLSPGAPDRPMRRST